VKRNRAIGLVFGAKGEQGWGLPKRLLDLALGIAIGDDAATRKVVPFPHPHRHRAGGDAQLQAASVSELAERAGVQTAPLGALLRIGSTRPRTLDGSREDRSANVYF